MMDAALREKTRKDFLKAIQTEITFLENSCGYRVCGVHFDWLNKSEATVNYIDKNNVLQTTVVERT
jgi:hypothetical protein